MASIEKLTLVARVEASSVCPPRVFKVVRPPTQTLSSHFFLLTAAHTTTTPPPIIVLGKESDVDKWSPTFDSGFRGSIGADLIRRRGA